MSGLDLLLAFANVVYLASYSVRDILWLRVLTVVGISLLMPYYYFQPDPLLAAIAWNALFLSINVFWIIKLLLERRPVQFTESERKLYEESFPQLTEREAFDLFRSGSHRSVPIGEELLRQGERVDKLTLITSGQVDVDVDGTPVDTLGEGRLLGVSSYLMRNDEFSAPVTVTAIDSTSVLEWSMTDLDEMFTKNEDLEVDVEASLGLELSRFLQTSRAQLLHPHLT